MMRWLAIHYSPKTIVIPSYAFPKICSNQIMAASPSLRVISSTARLCRIAFLSSANCPNFEVKVSLLAKRDSNFAHNTRFVIVSWSSRRSQNSSFP